MAKSVALLGAMLVLGPALAGGLVLGGVWQIAGSHGLGAWLFASSCAVLELGGTILCATAACRSPQGRRFHTALALLGGLCLLAFVLTHGLPFAR